MDHAVVKDSDIKVGSHMCTMGYSYGAALQAWKGEKLNLLFQGGSITQECTRYEFGFNAPAYKGSSGSPIFNDRGQLIGVLSNGPGESFNYGIKASHIKELLDRAE